MTADKPRSTGFAARDRDWAASDRAELMASLGRAADRRDAATESRHDAALDRVAAEGDRTDSGTDRQQAAADRDADVDSQHVSSLQKPVQ